MVRWLRNLFYRASLGDHSYRFLFEPGPPDEVVVLDCETTGLNPRTDEVIAIAALIVRGHRIMTSEPFRAVIRPDKDPTSTSIKVHRLRAQDVAEGRAMHEVLPELLRFIGGRPIVGYYVDFDIRMLDKYILRYHRGEASEPSHRGVLHVLRPEVRWCSTWNGASTCGSPRFFRILGSQALSSMTRSMMRL